MNEQKKSTEPLFDLSDRGYNVKAWYMSSDGVTSKDALVEIRWQERLIIVKRWPAYKIYNIAAHFSDIVDTRLDTVETVFLDKPAPESQFVSQETGDGVFYFDNRERLSSKAVLSYLQDAVRYRTELERANNEFSAATAKWPDLWQRIADLKANNEYLVRQNKALKSHLGQLWHWMKDAGCSFNTVALSLTESFFKDHPELRQWFDNQKEL